jgi:glycosyltransferase involved in cell wall biosynthesis
MSFGTPAVASSVSSLPEVVGDAGLLVDPLQVEAIAQAVAAICGDEGLWVQLSRKAAERARLFSWQEAARQTQAVYQQAATGVNSRRYVR